VNSDLHLTRVPPFQAWKKRKLLVLHMETPMLDVETCLKGVRIPFISLPFDEVALEKDIENHLDDSIGIIITGSRLVDRKLPELPHIVAECGLPKLGICYGHEALGKYLGSDIVKCNPPAGEMSRVITKFYPSVLFNGINMEDETIEKMEHFYMLDKLPNDCKLIASTKLTPIAGFECIEKGIFCIQFHPEKGFNQDMIFKNYFDFCVKFDKG